MCVWRGGLIKGHCRVRGRCCTFFEYDVKSPQLSFKGNVLFWQQFSILGVHNIASIQTTMQKGVVQRFRVLQDKSGAWEDLSSQNFQES